MDHTTLSLITIPLFTGAIGYVTNWSGVLMLFYPVQFHGIRVPGLKALSNLLPRRIQQIPGVMHGGVGWQGIIPSRATKMGSIAVDKGIAKLGSPEEFYDKLEPDKIAQHILATAERDIHETVERIMRREHAQLWRFEMELSRQSEAGEAAAGNHHIVLRVHRAAGPDHS